MERPIICFLFAIFGYDITLLAQFQKFFFGVIDNILTILIFNFVFCFIANAATDTINTIISP